MKNIELHPLCTLFPRMVGDEFAALCADIRLNGLRLPIVMHDGMILDGGNRYRACLEVGVKPTFTKYAGDSVVAFVLSSNLHRRHMTAGQQAAIVASAQDWAKAQPVGKPAADAKRCNVAPLDTAADRAAESGASLRTQKMADKVAKADPALAKQVAHGEVSLQKAATAVDEKAGKAKPAAKTTGGKKKAKAEPAANDPDLESPSEMLADMLKDIDRLNGLLAAADANDQKAEALKWRRAYDAAVRGQSEAMERAHKSAEREKWVKKQLMRCGKAVGEDDEFKIAPAVEAMARSVKVAA